MQKKIILIGGAPTTGKSTIARSLSKKLELPWISTDQIRSVMKSATSYKDNPGLFVPSGYEEAENFLNNFSAQEISDMEFNQAYSVWSGIEKIIQDKNNWKDGCIIEGVNIIPELVNKSFKKDNTLKSIFIIDENADRAREVIFNRGLFDDADQYSDGVKEKEVDWVMIFSKKLRIEANKYKFPIVEVSKDSDDLQKVLEILSII